MRARIAATGAALAAAAGMVTAGATSLSGAAAPTASGSGLRPLQARQQPADLVCPGPETMLAPDGGDAVDPRAVPVLSALVTATPAAATAAATARLSVLAADEAQPLSVAIAARPPGGAAGSEGSAGIALHPMRGAGAARLGIGAGGTGLFSAVQTTLARGGDLRGLVASGCGTATTEAWLVGGSTTSGRRGRLLLANPAPTPALVDVTVLGPDGPVRAPSGTGVVVPGEGEVALLVDALAPGLSRIAVHVRARTGRVVPTLHDTLLRGLVPGGADDVPVSRPPARRQVLSGLAVRTARGRSATEARSLARLQPGQPGASAIRVAVPGGTEGVVRVRLLGPDGAVALPDGGVVAVGAGSVADLPLAGVPDGNYGAVVSADVPVLAAGLVGRAAAGALAAGTSADRTGKAPPAEFGWTTAGKALGAVTLLALPAPGTVSTQVTLTAPSRPGRVEGHAIDEHGRIGPAHLFDVAAGTTSTITVTPRSSGVLLAPAGGAKVVAAVVVQADDPAGPMLSVLPVSPFAGGLRTTVGRVGDLGLGLRDQSSR